MPRSEWQSRNSVVPSTSGPHGMPVEPRWLYVRCRRQRYSSTSIPGAYRNAGPHIRCAVHDARCQPVTHSANTDMFGHSPMKL